MASSNRFFSRNFFARSRFFVTLAIGPAFLRVLSLVESSGSRRFEPFTTIYRRSTGGQTVARRRCESAKSPPAGLLTAFFVCGKLGVYTACFRRGRVARPRV